MSRAGAGENGEISWRNPPAMWRAAARDNEMPGGGAAREIGSARSVVAVVKSPFLALIAWPLHGRTINFTVVLLQRVKRTGQVGLEVRCRCRWWTIPSVSHHHSSYLPTIPCRIAFLLFYLYSILFYGVFVCLFFLRKYQKKRHGPSSPSIVKQHI